MTQALNNHPTDEELADLKRGALPQSERSRIHAHLEECRECTESARVIEAVIIGLRAESESHIPEDMLVQFQAGVFGSIDHTPNEEWSRERITGHLSYCHQCRAEIEFLANLDSAEPHGLLNPLPHSEPGRPRESTWRRRAVVISIATAAVLTIMVGTQVLRQTDRRQISWETVHSPIEKEKLIALSTRSGSADSSRTYEHAEDAALAEFRRLLEFRDGQFAPRELQRPTPSYLAGQTLVLNYSSGDGSKRQTSVEELPAGLSVTDGSLTCWLLVMPARDLRTSVIKSDTLNLDLNLRVGEFACFTWTEAVNARHRAFRGVVLK